MFSLFFGLNIVSTISLGDLFGNSDKLRLAIRSASFADASACSLSAVINALPFAVVLIPSCPLNTVIRSSTSAAFSFGDILIN